MSKKGTSNKKAKRKQTSQSIRVSASPFRNHRLRCLFAAKSFAEAFSGTPTPARSVEARAVPKDLGSVI